MALGLNDGEVAGRLTGRGAVPLGHSINDSRKTMFVAAILIVLQALDGVLTSVGVSRFGIAAEGNPLLRELMREFGHIHVLTIVKVTAILFVIALSYYAQRLAWVQRAMGAISCIYLFTAILPWTYILFIQQHL